MTWKMLWIELWMRIQTTNGRNPKDPITRIPDKPSGKTRREDELPPRPTDHQPGKRSAALRLSTTDFSRSRMHHLKEEMPMTTFSLVVLDTGHWTTPLEDYHQKSQGGDLGQLLEKTTDY